MNMNVISLTEQNDRVFHTLRQPKAVQKKRTNVSLTLEISLETLAFT